MEPRSAFAKHQASSRGLQKLCRQCHKETMKAHRERVRALSVEEIAQNRATNRKRCNRCATVGRNPTHPLDDFHESADTPDRKRPHCKDCVRELRWKRSGIINMTVERYEAMLVEQSFRCAIPSCKTLPNRLLDVDHDHATGEVRGLLCRACNVIAGPTRDSVELLADIIAYLNGDISLEPLLK